MTVTSVPILLFIPPSPLCFCLLHVKVHLSDWACRSIEKHQFVASFPFETKRRKNALPLFLSRLSLLILLYFPISCWPFINFRYATFWTIDDLCPPKSYLKSVIEINASVKMFVCLAALMLRTRLYIISPIYACGPLMLSKNTKAVDGKTKVMSKLHTLCSEPARSLREDAENKSV